MIFCSLLQNSNNASDNRLISNNLHYYIYGLGSMQTGNNKHVIVRKQKNMLLSKRLTKKERMKDKLMATSDPELKASLSLRRKKTEEMKTAEKKVESYDTSAM
jgi:hypothetical protein